MPPTTEPLRGDSHAETLVWTLADEKERQARRTHNSRGTCYGPSSNIPLRAQEICRGQTLPGDPNPFAINWIASSASSAYPAAAGGAMRVVNAKSSIMRSGPTPAPRRRDMRALIVRVIEYTHDDPHRPGAGECHRLITYLTNPEDLPVSEAPLIYHERWEEEELAFDEI
jgi:hypothetical protein